MGGQGVKQEFRERSRGTSCRAGRGKEKTLYSVKVYSNCLFICLPCQTVSSLQVGTVSYLSLQVEQGQPCERVFSEFMKQQTEVCESPQQCKEHTPPHTPLHLPGGSMLMGGYRKSTN